MATAPGERPSGREVPSRTRWGGNAENGSHSRRSAAFGSRSLELSFGYVMDSRLARTVSKGERPTRRLDTRRSLTLNHAGFLLWLAYSDCIVYGVGYGFASQFDDFVAALAESASQLVAVECPQDRCLCWARAHQVHASRSRQPRASLTVSASTYTWTSRAPRSQAAGAAQDDSWVVSLIK